jgi:hypothetical protein
MPFRREQPDGTERSNLGQSNPAIDIDQVPPTEEVKLAWFEIVQDGKRLHFLTYPLHTRQDLMPARWLWNDQR